MTRNYKRKEINLNKQLTSKWANKQRKKAAKLKKQGMISWTNKLIKYKTCKKK